LMSNLARLRAVRGMSGIESACGLAVLAVTDDWPTWWQGA
jgi:hypothetical protein